MLVGKWPGGHVSKQLCRPPAPPQTAAPVIIFRTIIEKDVIKCESKDTNSQNQKSQQNQKVFTDCKSIRSDSQIRKFRSKCLRNHTFTKQARFTCFSNLISRPPERSQTTDHILSGDTRPAHSFQLDVL